MKTFRHLLGTRQYMTKALLYGPRSVWRMAKVAGRGIDAAMRWLGRALGLSWLVRKTERRLVGRWPRLRPHLLILNRFGRRLRAGMVAALMLASVVIPAIIISPPAAAATQGPLGPALGADNSGVGTVSWSGPTNIYASDSTYASQSLSASAVGHYLFATNFGFSVPSGSTINGIQVDVQKYATTASKNSMEDNSVKIIQSGAATGTEHATTSVWPTSSSYVTYGSGSDLWGTSWTAAQVDASNFGIAISAKNVPSGAGSSALTAYVDYVRITVTYTPVAQVGQNSYRLFNNLDAGSSASVAFTAGQGSPYTTGTGPLDSKFADVNGDGCPDLVTANNSAYTVSVFLNKCDGTGQFNSKVDYATQTTPGSLAVGNLNGDNCPDIVTANNGSSTVSVFINKCDGSGTFNAQVAYPTGSYPNGVAVADVNGDGHLDILVVSNPPSTASSTFSELLNNGNGTFPTTTAGETTYGVGVYPRWIAVADLNGDGCPDAMVTNTSYSTTSDNTLSVLLNKCNGTGAFNSQVKYSTGTYPQFVTAGDLNGDGCSDAVVVNANSDNVSVFLNNCNGTGTFPTTAPTYSTGTSSNPWYAVIADFNGDGTPDIATADRGSGANNVAILLGSGSGVFPTTGPSTTYSVGTSPRSVAAADINGVSGKPDLAVTNFTDNTVSVLMNTSSMDVGSPLAAQNTAATTLGDSEPFRLRIDLGITNTTLNANAGTFKLQYALMSTSCDATTSGYSDVTNTSTVQYYNNLNGLNGAPLTANANDPTDGTNTLVYETYQQQGTTTFTNPNAIPSGEDGVWDFALTTYHTLAAQHYCLRIVNGGGTSLNSYASGATAELIMPPSTFTQANYRWFQNLDSADVGTPLGTQNVPADITEITSSQTNKPFRLRLLVSVGKSGVDVNGLSLKLQYAPISGGSCGATPSANFADISSSSPIYFYTGNINVTDGMSLTTDANDPTDGSNTIVHQTYDDASPFTNSQSLVYAGQDGLWDFPLQFASGAGHTTWCIRAVNSSDSSTINGYSEYSQIDSAATMQQLLRGREWWGADGTRHAKNLQL